MIAASPKNARAVMEILIGRPWTWPVRILIFGCFVAAAAVGFILGSIAK